MKPRLLLVEDDPTSRHFLQAALESLPARVETADSLAAALALDGPHDLWLLDANLPDGSGAELLALLRRRFPSTPALAHTADASPDLHAALRASGFADVLVKPLAAQPLHLAVAMQLGDAVRDTRTDYEGDASVAFPLWDHEVALAALNGNSQHVSTLRALFMDELGSQCAQVAAALGDGDTALAGRILHQLKASSGFVGAMRVHSGTVALERAPSDAAALQRFEESVRDTLESALNRDA